MQNLMRRDRTTKQHFLRNSLEFVSIREQILQNVSADEIHRDIQLIKHKDSEYHCSHLVGVYLTYNLQKEPLVLELTLTINPTHIPIKTK